MPGITSCLLNCVELYNLRYFEINGLGPTKDISPLKTLIKQGISSKLLFLKNNPNLVNLFTSGNKIPF